MRGVTGFSLLVLMIMRLTTNVQGAKNRILLPKDVIKVKGAELTLEDRSTDHKRTPSPSGRNIFTMSAIPTFYTAAKEEDSFPSIAPSHHEVAFQDPPTCKGKGGKKNDGKGAGKGGSYKGVKGGKSAKGASSKLPKSSKKTKSKFSKSGKSAERQECQDEELATEEPTFTDYPIETLGPELVIAELISNAQASSAAPVLTMGFALILVLLLPVTIMIF